jgi:heterotetrameric sarcosine oxidase gamma subunit
MQTALRPLARSPLHNWHAAHAARFEERQRAQVVLAYEGVEPEPAGLALVDLSVFSKLVLVGKGVPAVAGTLLEASSMSQPRVVGALPGPDRELACRLTRDRLLLLASSPTSARFEELMRKLSQEEDLLAADATASYAWFELLGPDTEQVLRRLTSLDVSRTGLPAGTCAETSLARIPGLIVRPPEGPGQSIHVLVASDLGEYVWETLLAAGSRWGIVPVGLASRQRFDQK